MILYHTTIGDKMAIYYYYVKRSKKEIKSIMVSTALQAIEESRQIAMDSGAAVGYIHKINAMLGAIKVER